MEKTLILIIILIIILGLYFIYDYFAHSVVKAPTTNELQLNGGFHGPGSQPSTKGPTEPPPGE